jgi:hypothetical protein
MPPDDASVFARMDAVLRSNINWSVNTDSAAKQVCMDVGCDARCALFFLTKSCVQLLADIRMLKKLLLYLPRYDCVTFQTFLDVLRAAAKDQKHPSLWMLTSAGDAVFTAAKERVYRVVPLSSCEIPLFRGPTVIDTKPGGGSVTYGLQVILEPNPKWSLLSDMLDEVEDALESAAIRDSDTALHARLAAAQPGAGVLVLTRDDRTSNSLLQYLTGDQALTVRQEFYRYGYPCRRIRAGFPRIPFGVDFWAIAVSADLWSSTTSGRKV